MGVIDGKPRFNTLYSGVWLFLLIRVWCAQSHMVVFWGGLPGIVIDNLRRILDGKSSFNRRISK
jgi:hypothetical protein